MYRGRLRGRQSIAAAAAAAAADDDDDGVKIKSIRHDDNDDKPGLLHWCIGASFAILIRHLISLHPHSGM